MLMRSLILKVSSLRPVETLVRRSFLFRPLVRRFIAGDTLEEALRPSEALMAQGLNVSLDYLGENTKSEAEALEAKATYVRMLERIDQIESARMVRTREPVSVPAKSSQTRFPEFVAEPINISIKLTQCGLDQGEDFAERNYREVVQAAARLGTFVRVDMEASEYTERTLRIVERVFRDHPNTGTVLQSYLYRTDEDVERLIGLGMRVRLVKGAYLEPASVAYPEKSKVDEAYVRQSKRLMEAGHYPAIATHDAAIITTLNAFAAENGIEARRYEFQMLYGIRRDLQHELHAKGHPVRVYVPFGDSWYPYFTRRLAERPANALFILRSTFRR